MKTESLPLHRKVLLSDEALLDSFDPVIEGSSFQILEEGIDPGAFSRSASPAEEVVMPESVGAFDLAASLARIPDKLFFRIGDAAELLDVKPYVLRFWETEFPMVRPTKSRSGQRVYRKRDVEMLLLIKHLLYVERFSIEGARKRIRELKLKPATAAQTLSAKSVASASIAPESAIVSGHTVSGARLGEVREIAVSLRTLAALPSTHFFRF